MRPKHKESREHLEGMGADFGDLTLHNEVRWLPAVVALERFFRVAKLISNFLENVVKSDFKEMEQKLESANFSEELAYLTDMTQHINELNLKLQGKDRTTADLVGHVKSFRSIEGFLNWVWELVT